MSDVVIAALREAVQRSPEEPELRVHLAELLVMSGDPAEALEHASVALASTPDNVHALSVARDAARALGDVAKARAYERLLGVTTPESRPPTVPLATSTDGPDEADGPDERSLADEFEAFGRDHEPHRSTVTLADVGGMEKVKERLELSFLGPLRNPELRSYYGKSLRGGLLLYGPPGCGKTYIASAVAGELGSAFFPVGLNDVLDMWLGESERRLHEIFELARRHAPCVLFLDELDGLGRKRSQTRNSAGRNVINQLLMELDGVQNSNEGVFVLAATNHPWDVDVALRRPGRLDRTVLVLPPDETARLAILTRNMEERPTDRINLAKVAKRTDGLSGADLAGLCEAAGELALHDSIRSGQARPITESDFDRALKDVHASTTPWFTIAHGYAVYANDGGQYDDLLAYVREKKLL